MAFAFAETCVFDKQSLGPLHCGHLSMAPLLPKLRGHFYGVILPSSLTRVLPFVLEFSSRLPVSVCGTGTSKYLAAFLAGGDSKTSFPWSTPRHSSGFRLAFFTTSHPHCLDALFRLRASSIFPCHCFINSLGSTGLSTCCPSRTPFGLRLGPDLLRADEPSPENLRLSTAEFLAPLSLLMPAFSLLYSPHYLPIVLLPVYIAPLPMCIRTSLSFGVRFEPR